MKHKFVLSNDLAIDCRLRNSTGIGRYISELVPRAVAALPERRIVLLGPRQDDPWFRERIAPIRGDVATIASDARVFRMAEQRLYRAVARQARVFWCTHFNVPWTWPRNQRLVVNVHDLIPVHVAVGWKGRIRWLGAKWYLAAVRRRADRILVLSQAVADELVQEQRFERSRLRPIHLGVAPEWFTADRTTCPRLGQEPFVLYLGNISPHKNVGALLQAFAEVTQEVPQRLVIVGERRGFTEHADFGALVAHLGSRVVFAQRLADGELRGLVAAADLLVQPSLEEGFGLPPLEAMAAGTPVLTSDCAALLETAARGAHRFALRDPGDLAAQLRRLLTDRLLLRSKTEEGRAWARQFTWERTAEQTVAVLREVLA
ncbi:MAG TPA: glycosyltransferase family 1 protein [Opitutaceae bacterium]|nr:glycosyltransferase family 1 protein [Opitutaceae bacterium]